MTQDPEKPAPANDNGWLAVIIEHVTAVHAEREAKNPSPPSPPEPKEPPWPDKPGELIAAEKDLFRWEICVKLRKALCSDTNKCEDPRCRRRRRCRELDMLTKMSEESRAHLAAMQAKWPAPQPQPEPAPKRKRKGRTGVRP